MVQAAVRSDAQIKSDERDRRLNQLREQKSHAAIACASGPDTALARASNEYKGV